MEITNLLAPDVGAGDGVECSGLGRSKGCSGGDAADALGARHPCGVVAGVESDEEGLSWSAE